MFNKWKKKKKKGKFFAIILTFLLNQYLNGQLSFSTLRGIYHSHLQTSGKILIRKFFLRSIIENLCQSIWESRKIFGTYWILFSATLWISERKMGFTDDTLFLHSAATKVELEQDYEYGAIVKFCFHDLGEGYFM